MTAQILDECLYEGEIWYVGSLPRGAQVLSKELGIETRFESTANYTGRVDTYALIDGRLTLESVRATGLKTTHRFRGTVTYTAAENSTVRFDRPLDADGWMVIGRDLDWSHGVTSPRSHQFRERVYLRLEHGEVVETRRDYGRLPNLGTPPMTRVQAVGCAAYLAAAAAFALPISWLYRIALFLLVVGAALLLSRPTRPPPGPTVF